MTIFDTAAEALADETRGAKTVRGAFEEAMKMAGQPAMDVHGQLGWYTTPISQAPGSNIWHVGISLDQEANNRSIEAVRRNRNGS